MHIPHAGKNIEAQKDDRECTEDRGDYPAYKYMFREFLKACKIDLSHFLIPFSKKSDMCFCFPDDLFIYPSVKIIFLEASDMILHHR